MDVGGLCRRHRPCGAPVQPVDQVEGSPLPQMVQQPGGQCRLSRRQGGRDAGQRCRLVHHQQMFILKEDIQRHGHRLHPCGPLRGVQVHRQPVPLPEDGVGKHSCPVDGKAGPGPLQPAHKGSGNTQFPAQQAFHRTPGLLPGHHKLQSRHTRPPALRYGSSIQYPLLIFNRLTAGK